MMHRDPSTSLGMTARTKRLLLFDIDGTLIHSGGAGVHALKSAFKERFGIADDLHGIEIAGMTDSGIVVSILNKHKIPATNENVSAFLDSYVHFLSLELPRRKGKLLPGVLELLRAPQVAATSGAGASYWQCIPRRAAKARSLRCLALF